MKTRKTKPSFEPSAFLAKVAVGRTISKHQDGQIVFSQGEPADSVFHIQKGRDHAAGESSHHSRTP